MIETGFIPQEKRSINIKSFLQLLKSEKLKKSIIIMALVLGLIETVAGLVVPLFTRDLIDLLSNGGIKWRYILLLLGAFILQTVAGGFSYYLMTYVGESIVANIRRKLWGHVLDMPIPYFDQHESGETMSRITQDTNVIKMLVTNHLITFISGIVSIVGSVVLLIIIDWKITLFIFLVVPISMLIIMPLGRLMFKISKRTQDEMAKFSGHLGRVLNDIRLVKSYNAQELEKETGSKEIFQLMRFSLKEAKVNAVVSPIMTTVMMVILVVIIGYGGARVAAGDLTAGSLVAIIIFMFNILMPFSQMATFFTTFQKALGATERINEILSINKEQTGKLTFVDLTKPIQFENVSFSYDHQNPILKNITFTIEPGKTYAFVGPSGGGKTTIFSLIERFYHTKEGKISLDETNINEFNLSDWRSSIGYVSQEVPIISGTIKDNICYGLEEVVTFDEIKEAARRANALEFINKLPEGFETEVGERGIKLSGGQRQRIAIARAILRNPKILLLDEATSNLDSESEELVQEAIRNVMEGRTTLIIAHRLSTVVDADEIFVIEKGEITGRGTHEELLTTHDLYNRLVKHQFNLQTNGE